jgi:arylsulfatase
MNCDRPANRINKTMNANRTLLTAICGLIPAGFGVPDTSNATFDIGTDLDSPVALDYFDQAPFAFNGAIGTTTIKYLKK